MPGRCDKREGKTRTWETMQPRNQHRVPPPSFRRPMPFSTLFLRLSLAQTTVSFGCPLTAPIPPSSVSSVPAVFYASTDSAKDSASSSGSTSRAGRAAGASPIPTTTGADASSTFHAAQVRVAVLPAIKVHGAGQPDRNRPDARVNGRAARATRFRARPAGARRSSPSRSVSYGMVGSLRLGRTGDRGRHGLPKEAARPWGRGWAEAIGRRGRCF